MITAKLKNLAIRLLARTRADRERELHAALRKASKPLILVMGDSLVAGSAIANNQSDVYNAAVGRSRISDVLALINRIKSDRIWDKVAGVVISCGLNDAEKTEGEDLSRRTSYFRFVIEALASACQEKPLIFLTTTPIGDEGLYAGRYNRELLVMQNSQIRCLSDTFDMNQRFAEACQGAGVPLAQVFTDGVHLSKVGYTLWTPLLNECVERVRAGLVQPEIELAA